MVQSSGDTKLEAQPSSNLELWNAVVETDEKFTKKFQRGGGFSGTAINSTYLVRKATELWGPMGSTWGVEVISEGLMQGAPMIADDYEEEYDYEDGKQIVTKTSRRSTVIGHEQIHYIRIRLRYPGGFVEHFGQTTFVGKNKHGFFTDEEAPKKSLTDAIGKALSMLGFGGDIFLGLFDDSKYINDKRARAEEEAKAEEAKAKAAAAVQPKVTADELTKAKDLLKACKTVEDLRRVYASLNDPLKAATKEYSQALAKGLE